MLLARHGHRTRLGQRSDPRGREGVVICIHYAGSLLTLASDPVAPRCGALTGLRQYSVLGGWRWFHHHGYRHLPPAPTPPYPLTFPSPAACLHSAVEHHLLPLYGTICLNTRPALHDTLHPHLPCRHPPRLSSHKVGEEKHPTRGFNGRPLIASPAPTSAPRTQPAHHDLRQHPRRILQPRVYGHAAGGRALLRRTGQEKVTPRHLLLHPLREGEDEKLVTFLKVT